MEAGSAANSDNSNLVANKVRNVDQHVISILKTVLERCKKEKTRNCLQVPLEDYYERVSFYTAFPKMFIYDVVDDQYFGEDNFDINDHITLMDCINIFLTNNHYIKINDLYEKFKQETQSKSSYIPDLKTFERKIYSLGYVYKKILQRPLLVLIENPKLKFERYNYLYKIKNYRDNKRQIYYLDERHIFKNFFRIPCKDYQENKHQLFDGLVFFHIMSAIGYEFGIFVSYEQDRSLEEIFKKWMLDIVLYSIKPDSVIVMVNNFIHGRQPRKPITQYHSKKSMLQWLRDNNIPCDPTMNKPRLYELIEKCKINNEDYDIDRIFKLHGHDVLRLPTTFPSLTPTSSMWDWIKKHFNKYNKNLGHVKNNLLSYISNFDRLTWSGFIDLTVTLENRIFEIDLLTENLLEYNYEFDENCFYEESSNFNIEDILEQ